MNGRQLRAGLRRWAWAGIALWLLVMAGTVAGYLRTPPVYIATQQLDVVLIPSMTLTTTDHQRLDAQAAAVASTIASDAFLASQPFTTAVSQQLASLNGANASSNLSPDQVGSALSATHTGTLVTISARAGSPTQAVHLVQATAHALTQQATALLTLPNTATLRLISDQQPTHTIRDAAADEAARDLLLARLALATVTALLAVLALAWIGSEPSIGHAATSTASEGAEHAQT